MGGGEPTSLLKKIEKEKQTYTMRRQQGACFNGEKQSCGNVDRLISMLKLLLCK